MQLTRKVIIGNSILKNSGEFIKNSEQSINKIAIISGKNVKNKVSEIIEESLSESNLQFEWVIANDASFQQVDSVTNLLNDRKISIIIGLGGGRCIDLGKMIATRLRVPFVSIPTSASHDGISSPFVSLKGNDRPYSIKADTPIEIIGDLDIISNAPYRLIASGCGDLIAKTTATKDWELARDYNNEYYGEYAAKLAHLGSLMVMDISKKIIKSEITVQVTRTIVEGLISSGVAAGIAGSSRPCSGSEHLFSHALEYITDGNCGLHGERVGIGTIIMSKLYGMDFERIISVLENVKAPVKANQINLSEKDIVQSLLIAQDL